MYLGHLTQACRLIQAANVNNFEDDCGRKPIVAPHTAAAMSNAGFAAHR
jgi:hypothetical protein